MEVPQQFYPGGLVGQSGSNDGTSPHWLKAFTYDDGVSSFSEETIWEGTKDEFHVYPPAEFHSTLKLANLTTTERNALTGDTGMVIYNTTESRIEYYDGAWKYLSGTAV